eukprot:2572908-Karenia_brevis.AAC.1
MLTGRAHTAVDMEVWRLTLAEVDEGLLEGPLTQQEVEKRLGPLWTGARRFGIVQSNKTRPIDDFSQFYINAAFGAEEKVSILRFDDV